jgi:hypothetical protein
MMKEVNILDNYTSWNLKLPLKIKIFMWYLKREVILTKDNLIKRNWRGCTKLCFCSFEESIHHLFFECHLARLVRNIISISFGIHIPNISEMYGSWKRSFSCKQRKTVMIGVTALCWAIWHSRNVSKILLLTLLCWGSPPPEKVMAGLCRSRGL